MKTDYQKITKHVRRKYYQYSPTLVHITGGQVYVILNQVPMSNHSHKVYCGSIQSVLDEAQTGQKLVPSTGIPAQGNHQRYVPRSTERVSMTNGGFESRQL